MSYGMFDVRNPVYCVRVFTFAELCRLGLNPLHLRLVPAYRHAASLATRKAVADAVKARRAAGLTRGDVRREATAICKDGKGVAVRCDLERELQR